MIDSLKNLSKADLVLLMSCLEPGYGHSKDYFPLCLDSFGSVTISVDSKVITDWTTLPAFMEEKDGRYFFDLEQENWDTETTISFVSKGTGSSLEVVPLATGEWLLTYGLKENSCYRYLLDKLEIRDIDQKGDPQFTPTENFSAFEDSVLETFREATMRSAQTSGLK